MRPDRAFRPRISDHILEDRVVLSLGTSGGQLLVTVVQSVPDLAFVQGNPAVQAATTAFATQYDATVRTVLFAPGPDGTINPVANLAAFEAQVNAELQTLAKSLSAALASSTQTSSLVPAVQQAILGSGAGSLQSQLAAFAASVSGAANAVPVFIESSSQAVQEASNRVVVVAQLGGRPLVAQGGSATGSDAPGGLRLSALNQASPRIKHAFDMFTQTYFSAMKNLLLAGGDAQANQVAFQAQVGAALDQLDANIARILNDLHEGPAQAAQVHQALIGNEAQSLKNRLAALPTPAPGTGTSMPILQELSSQLIANSLLQASGTLSSLVPGLK
jgi:hypothetical protein